MALPVSYTHLDVYKRQEKEEQLALRQEYIAAFRRSLTGQLDNTWIVDEKGNKRKLERRPGVAKKKTAAVEPMPLKVNMENNGKKTADE